MSATATPVSAPGPGGQLPHEIVWNLTNAIIASRSIHVIAALGVADHIDDTPVPVEQLASACGAHPGALDRVLQLLTANGVFRRRAAAYSHTEASRLLRSDHPLSMRAFPHMNGLPVLLATFDRLEHSVRTGAPAIELVEGGGLWPYLQQHPGEMEIFGQAMIARAAADIGSVLGAYDFSRFGSIADIGGGRGHLLRAVLDAVPLAQGILFDLPGGIGALDVDCERITAHAGDFFVDALPAADAYLLMEVIHDWADAEAAAILSAVRRAASPGARVLIIENVLDDDRPDPRGHTLDVVLLLVTGGRERTGGELSGLLRTAGFQSPRVIDTAGPLSIVEAVAA